MSRSGVTVSFAGPDIRATQQYLETHKGLALLEVRSTSEALRLAQEQYEKAVIHANELDCGPSAIGQSAGRSESTIRGFLRRRKRDAA